MTDRKRTLSRAIPLAAIVWAAVLAMVWVGTERVEAQRPQAAAAAAASPESAFLTQVLPGLP